MRPKKIVVAASAPRTTNIGSRKANEATVRMLAGEERDPERIQEHLERFLRHHLQLLRVAGEGGAEIALVPEDCLRLGPFIAKQGRRKSCRKAVEAAHDLLLDRFGEVSRQGDGRTTKANRGRSRSSFGIAKAWPTPWSPRSCVCPPDEFFRNTSSAMDISPAMNASEASSLAFMNRYAHLTDYEHTPHPDTGSIFDLIYRRLPIEWFYEPPDRPALRRHGR